MSETTAKCLIGLGGNTGPVEQTFERALHRLEQAGCMVQRCSHPCRSVPMGSSAGGEFVNAAALVTTSLEPEALLALLQKVEDACGRVRSTHWGPRTLDLDLLFYDQRELRTPRLTVPHPGIWYRRFVLEPLLEIAPEWQHPANGLSIKQLHARLQRHPLVIELDGLDPEADASMRVSYDRVQLRAADSQAVNAAGHEVAFCRLRADSTAERLPSLMRVDSAGFQITVHPADVSEMLGAVVAAALGE